MHGRAKVKKIFVLHWTLKIEYPSPEMILTGEVTQWSNAERTKDDANAVLVKQDRRAETGMAPGKTKTKGVEQDKNEAAKLLQQFSGTLRFGKRRLHLQTV